MSSTEMPPGVVRQLDTGSEGRLQREIEHARTAVWKMLTEPDALVRWLAPGTIDPRPGGVVRLDFAESGATIDSTIRDLDPPRLLEYSWSRPGEPERPLTWELVASEAGTRLTLTLRLPPGEDIATSCAGWDAHLEMLLAALEGVPIRFPLDHFRAARQAFREQLARADASGASP